MPKRRRGQVKDLGGGKFRIRIFTGRDGQGKKHYHNETLFDTTPLKAEKRCIALLAEVDGGTFFEASQMLVKDYFEKEWLPQKRREGVRPTTYGTYQDMIDLYIAPYLGAFKLSDLTPKHTRDFAAWLWDRGKSTATMKLARAVWHMGMKDAVTLKYIKENPATGIKHLKSLNPPREGKAFNVPQAIQFLQAATQDPEDLIYIFGLVTGLRPEELSGLRREDISFENGRGIARIRKVALLVEGKWKLLDPKTENSKRDARFPAHIYYDLLRHFQKVDERRKLMGNRWQDFGLVFPSSDGRPLNTTGRLRSGFLKLVKKAGLPPEFTPYTMRYSFATLSLLAGELDKAVSAQMGHSDVNFTKKVYTKVLPQMKESLSDSFESLLFKASDATLTHEEAERVM